MEENKSPILENEEALDAVEEAGVISDAEVVSEEDTAIEEGTDIEDGIAEEAAEEGEAVELNYNVTEDGELSGLTDAQRKRAMIFDKITTGILAFLICSPLLILLYILLWFILKN